MRFFRLLAVLAALIFLAAPAWAQSAPTWVQDNWTWCSSGLPNGNFHRITGPETTDPDYLAPPDWLSSKFYITYARAMHSANPATYPGMNGQFVVGVDRGSISYSTSGGNGQTGNNSRWLPLANIFLNAADPQERSHLWNPPVYVDLSVDTIWFDMELNGGPPGTDYEQACFEIGILEPAPATVPVAIPPTQQ